MLQLKGHILYDSFTGRKELKDKLVFFLWGKGTKCKAYVLFLSTVLPFIETIISSRVGIIYFCSYFFSSPIERERQRKLI